MAEFPIYRNAYERDQLFRPEQYGHMRSLPQALEQVSNGMSDEARQYFFGTVVDVLHSLHQDMRPLFVDRSLYTFVSTVESHEVAIRNLVDQVTRLQVQVETLVMLLADANQPTRARTFRKFRRTVLAPGETRDTTAGS